MKTKIISFLFLIGILSSCANNAKKPFSIIKGRLPNLASAELQINLNDSIYRTTLNDKGRFRLEIQLNQPKYLFISGLNIKLFMIPNDSVFLENPNNKYVFKGNQSALINNYYSHWNIYKEKVTDTTNFESYYNQPPDKFVELVNKWIEVYKQPLYALKRNNPELNPDFIFLESERIKYMLYSDLNDYKNTSAKISDDFYNYLNDVNLNDTSLMQFDEYRYFLNSFIRMHINKMNLEDKTYKTSKMLEFIEETFHYEFILNEISFGFMREQTNNLSVNDTLINKFKNICTNKDYVRSIEENYKLLKPLLKGKSAPDFELIGLDGCRVTLNHFKGKYLLIDVWSTSCTPCIKEFPHMEKLTQKLEGKNIKIITACISEEESWKTTLSKYGLKKDQFRIENGWKSEFRKDYLKTSGVPVYILISPDGKIIDARAPKPSENLYEVIQKLNF